MDFADLEIVCIGAPRAHERRSRMTALFEARGLDAAYREGCDALHIDRETLISTYDPDGARRMGLTPITVAEQACSESHFRTLGAFLDGSKSCLLVFEDNADFDDALVDFLRRFEPGALNFELIKFEERRKRRQVLPVAACGPVSIDLTPQVGAGAVAILYSRAGAAKLFGSRHGYTHCYDNHLSLFWRHGAFPLVVRPPLARRARIASTVDATDAKLGGTRRRGHERSIGSRVRRIGYRFWRMVGKYRGCLHLYKLTRSPA